MTGDAHYVGPDQLCIGLFVYVDLPWMDHPFPFSRFKIRNEQQIETLRELGIERIRYEPSRSDCAPRPMPVVDEAATPAAEQPVHEPPGSAHAAALAEKRARIEQLAQIRREIEEVERRFVKAADTLKAIGRTIHSRSAEAFEAADQLVSTLVATVLDRGDVKLHAMSQQLGEDVYFHSLNVAVLAMILGRAVHLRADELHQLGLGALFHDIGQLEIPDAILAKRERLTRAEQALLETHCRQGVKLGRKLGLSDAALAVVAQHHELADGSGYPERLQGNQITVFARIVAIANRYDNLCNPTDLQSAITPNEALSQMFARERPKYDDELLRRFVRCLGVYPPGSLVVLSDERFGLVLSVNPEQPLRPDVMVYDPDVPKEAALIVRLVEQSELKIVRSLRAGLLPREVFGYLSPRERVTYYCEGERERPR